jgi:uncharacterized protein (DUF2236 family)
VGLTARSRLDSGLFGPDSVAWRVDREVVLLAGGTAALLLQLAHPAVAAGVAQHSDFQADAFGRLRRTLTSSYAVVFGTTPRAERAIARMNAIHAAVRGTVPETGRRYAARDPRLLLWVHETLIDTALRIYERFVAPLTPAEADAYHAEGCEVAIRLGVPADQLPSSLADLRADMRHRVASGEVAVSPTARQLRDAVLYPARFPPRWIWDAAHLVSFSLLPPAIRSGYEIPWNPRRQRAVERFAVVSRRLLPLVPPALRYMPQARSAERRLHP